MATPDTARFADLSAGMAAASLDDSPIQQAPLKDVEAESGGLSRSKSTRQAYTGNVAQDSSRVHNGNVYNVNNNHYPQEQRMADLHLDPDSANERLFLAASDGQTERLRLLLRSGASVDYMSPDGLTALHWAALGGFEDVVKELFAVGADVNPLSRAYGTPLCLAALKGRMNIIRLLLENRASASMPGGKLGSAIHCAAWSGDQPVLEYLFAFSHADIDLKRSGGNVPDFEDAEALVKMDSSERTAGDNDDDVVSEARADEDDEQFTYGQCTPLSVAASRGNSEVVRWLLYKRAQVGLTFLYGTDNGTQITGSTALHDAPYGGNLDVVNLLLSNGADASAKMSDGRTPLFTAAQSGYPDILDTFIQHGASVHDCDAVGVTPLLSAAMGSVATSEYLAAQDFHRCVQALLYYGSNVNATEKASGMNALMHLVSRDAARTPDVSLVELLLNGGIIVNAQNFDGDSALHLACTNMPNIATLLLRHGADTNLRNQNGLTPLHVAAKSEHEGLVNEILRSGARVAEADNQGENALLKAVIFDRIDTVRAILDTAGSSIDIDATDTQGRSALAAACDSPSNTALARLLLERGASPDVKHGTDQGPLFIASRSGDVEISRVLLDYGAVPDQHLSDGKTPLHVAAEYGSEGCVSLLLERQAYVNVIDNKGRTAISYAAEFNHSAVVRKLLSANADPWAVFETPAATGNFQERDAQGWVRVHGGVSAVTSAVAWGRLEILKLFDRFGVDLHGQTLGMSMLHLAAACGHLDIVQYLILREADVYEKDSKGRTAYTIAIQADHEYAEEIKHLLREEMSRQPPKVTQSYTHTDSQTTLVQPPAVHNQLASHSGNLGRVVALYAYLPTNSGELELQSGDKITLTQELGNDWWRGISDRTGREGSFPGDYVDVFQESEHERPRLQNHAFTTPVPQSFHATEFRAQQRAIAHAVVVWAYAHQYPADLELQTDDKIDVLEYVDESWWKGRSGLTGQEGIFPSSHVKILPHDDSLYHAAIPERPISTQALYSHDPTRQSLAPYSAYEPPARPLSAPSSHEYAPQHGQYSYEARPSDQVWPQHPEYDSNNSTARSNFSMPVAQSTQQWWPNNTY